MWGSTATLAASTCAFGSVLPKRVRHGGPPPRIMWTAAAAWSQPLPLWRSKYRRSKYRGVPHARPGMPEVFQVGFSRMVKEIVRLVYLLLWAVPCTAVLRVACLPQLARDLFAATCSAWFGPQQVYCAAGHGQIVCFLTSSGPPVLSCPGTVTNPRLVQPLRATSGVMCLRGQVAEQCHQVHATCPWEHAVPGAAFCRRFG
jgi:hypothetical protein